MVSRALPIRVAAVRKLSPEQLRQLLWEMELAEQFTEKRWSERFHISPRSIRRLRAEVLGRRWAGNRPATRPVVRFTTPSTGGRKA